MFIDHALLCRGRVHNPNGALWFAERDATGEISSDQDRQISVIEGEQKEGL